MKIMNIHYLALLLLLGSPLAAKDSVVVQGDSYPVKISAQEVEWNLIGTEHFKYKVFFSVFTAAYYQQINGDGEKLSFTYTRDLKADDLREQAMKQLVNSNDPVTLEKYKDLTAQIQAAYLDVKENDSYTVTSVPEKGIWLHLNGKELFFSDNAEFGNWYLDIWLGNPPISDSLKDALTKGASS
jgi:hypothetical protein